MKKVFTIFGYVSAGIVALILIVVLIYLPRGLRLQNAGLAYVKTNLPAIVETWSPKALVDRSTPELIKNSNSTKNLDRLFQFFSKLGKLKHLDEPVKGKVFSGSNIGTGSYTISDYTVHGDFANGPATILLQLSWDGNAWKINGFHVNSDVFLQK